MANRPLAAVVVVGAYKRAAFLAKRNVGVWVDRLFGDGAYRSFIRALKPELLFAMMCACIVLCGLVRQLAGTVVLPPTVLGFY